MDEAFFERLYRGYAAEHLVASQLYRVGYEVFRLPADFGLDLVVTNQFMVAKKQMEASALFPFALQVKSRWLQTKDTVVGPSGRPETKVSFQLKADELKVVVDHKNAGVVFVAYVPVGGSRGYDPFYFWLHAAQLDQAAKMGFLVPEGEKYTLTVRYRRLPRQSREEFVKEIEAAGALSAGAKKMLLKELPPTFPRNWKASDYLGFARKARDGSNALTFKSVWNVPMNFEGFPAFSEIGGLD